MQRLGRADRVVQHAENATKAGNCGLCLVQYLGELGDRLEEPVRQEDESHQRTRRQAGPGAADDTDADDRGDGEHAEDLAGGEQERADGVGSDERVRALVARPFGQDGVVGSGAVRLQSFGA